MAGKSVFFVKKNYIFLYIYKIKLTFTKIIIRRDYIHLKDSETEIESNPKIKVSIMRTFNI